MLGDEESIRALKSRLDKHITATHPGEKYAGRIRRYMNGTINNPTARAGHGYRIEIRNDGVYLIDALSRHDGTGTKIFP